MYSVNPLTTVSIRDGETEKENKCCFWAPTIRELVSLLVCACVYKGGGCRQTGSGGLQNRTGHHNSSARSLATDRQAGVNADGSLIGICHQQPTKSIYLQGGNPALFSHSDKHAFHKHRSQTHSQFSVWLLFCKLTIISIIYDNISTQQPYFNVEDCSNITTTKRKRGQATRILPYYPSQWLST